jgi:hypothetical protein
MEMALANWRAREGLTFHSDRGALRGVFPWPAAGTADGGSAERGPEGEPLGQRPRGNFFQNAQTGVGNGGHEEAEVRQSVFLCLEAYYNRILLHSALDYVAPNVFNSGKAP